MKQEKFKVNDKIVCIKTSTLSDTGVKPPLTYGEDYVVKEIQEDKKGNQHLDVGLKSKYNYITSLETGDELDRGNIIHWCHPSRFKLKEG